MTSLSTEELEAFREEGLSEERRRAIRASVRATERWEREHPIGLEQILDWIDQLRLAFGEPAVDTRPWKGSDFRL